MKRPILPGGDASHINCDLQGKDDGEGASRAGRLDYKRHGDIKGPDVFEEKMRKKWGDWSTAFTKIDSLALIGKPLRY